MSQSVFLETSALLRLLFNEKGGDDISEKLMKSSRIVASRLTRLEAERALFRLALQEKKARTQIPELRNQLKHVWSMTDFMEITKEVCDLAGSLSPGSFIRSLDAIHLASYLIVKEFDPKIEMISCDQRILQEI